MRYLVTAAEMKKYDLNMTEKIGIPSLVLMERAALESFYVLKEKGLIRKGANALILAGYGNNGGDGLALARLLSEAGVDTDVLLVGTEEKATDSWRVQRAVLNVFPVSFVKHLNEKAYHIVIDSLFGVGLKRNLSEEYKKAVEMVNGLSGFKLALDAPSGVSVDDGRVLGTAFRADLTVTFAFDKVGLHLWPGSDYVGELLVKDVGISEKAFFGETPGCFTLEESMSELLPQRRQDGNKGTFGKALVMAGAFQMAGAAMLCTKACYRTGAGMVKALSVPENRVILQESVPEALFGALTDENEISKSMAWCDVICIGPGLGMGEIANRALLNILTTSDETILKKPLVIDADALNLISGSKEKIDLLKEQGRRGRTLILTPHLMELLRLWNGCFENEKLDLTELKEQVSTCAYMLSKELGAIVVAKDARTFISMNGRPLCMNLSGNSGMATAGSGDVLAGMITAFLAQSKEDPFLLTCKAVRYHGLMGELATKKIGEHALTAGDLIAQ